MEVGDRNTRHGSHGTRDMGAVRYLPTFLPTDHPTGHLPLLLAIRLADKYTAYVGF